MEKDHTFMPQTVYAHTDYVESIHRLKKHIKTELQGRKVWAAVGRSTFAVLVGEYSFRTRVSGVNVKTGKYREFEISDIVREWDEEKDAPRKIAEAV